MAKWVFHINVQKKSQLKCAKEIKIVFDKSTKSIYNWLGKLNQEETK